MAQRVYLFNQDISEFVTEVPGVTLNSGEYGQVTIAPIPSLLGNNARNFWDTGYQASPFFGAQNLQNYALRIENDGQVVFDGAVLNIAPDPTGKTATIQLRTALMDALEGGCGYASDDFNDGGLVTPSTAIAQILTQYNIPYDPGSFAAADALYGADNVDLFIFCLGDQSIMSVIQRIAEFGVAKVYMSGGLVRIDVYDPDRDLDPLYTFSDLPTNQDGCTLLQEAPKAITIQKDVINGYSIKWVNPDLPADFGDSTAKKKTLDGSATSDIQIPDLDTAVWIGERWLSYMQRPQDLIRWFTRADIAKQLDLGYPVAVHYTRWGNPITVDLVTINNAATASAELVGVTR